MLQYLCECLQVDQISIQTFLRKQYDDKYLSLTEGVPENLGSLEFTKEHYEEMMLAQQLREED